MSYFLSQISIVKNLDFSLDEIIIFYNFAFFLLKTEFHIILTLRGARSIFVL